MHREFGRQRGSQQKLYWLDYITSDYITFLPQCNAQGIRVAFPRESELQPNIAHNLNYPASSSCVCSVFKFPYHRLWGLLYTTDGCGICNVRINLGACRTQTNLHKLTQGIEPRVSKGLNSDSLTTELCIALHCRATILMQETYQHFCQFTVCCNESNVKCYGTSISNGFCCFFTLHCMIFMPSSCHPWKMPCSLLA